MIAKEWPRTILGMWVALVAVGVLGTSQANAQQGRKPFLGKAQASRPDVDQAKPADTEGVPTLKAVVVPVNPNDPVAVINGEEISRRTLADECVVRRGQEILDTLIARKLIEQAIKAKHLDVTAAEIDAEIDHVAQTMAGVGREAWLRSLDKERGISPVQYARDIIYPSLALRKLASPKVQVTAQDLKDAYDAHFGDKLRCRIIMVDKLRMGQEIWEELKKNPGGFEKLAQEKSIDMTSRSLGGLLGEPITRHAYPATVSDAAFQQLVDGDPKDNDPKHKPKDGDFTGPIQVSDASWVIIRREGVVPAQKVNADDPKVKQMLNEMMFEAKLKVKMGEVFEDLRRSAAIENKLTGQTKLANEEMRPEHQVDGKVKLMSNPEAAIPPPAGAPPTTSPKQPTPAGVSADAANTVESLKRPLKARSATSPAGPK